MVMKVKVLQQAGKSPESFQAHPGEEIQPYLDADMLLDLSAVWEYAGLEERVLPGIADLCQTEGRQVLHRAGGRAQDQHHLLQQAHV